MLHLLAGLALVGVTWGALRRSVGAPLLGPPGAARLPVLLIDLAAPVIGFGLFLLPTGRPILAGIAIAALGFGLGIADVMKRRILDEPVLFADRAELLDVVRHPRLYLGFVGIGPAIAIFLGIVAAIAALMWAEPPLWHVTPVWFVIGALAALAIGRAAFVLPSLASPTLVRLYVKLGPTRDAVVDIRRFGLTATCIIHATIARAERAGRQRMAQSRSLSLAGAQGPIVMIQAESFVDVTRIDPHFAGTLPHYAALARDAVLAGRLAVPCWGANTIRTELATLSGIDDGLLGLDRFNPYDVFAHVPLPTLASAARAAGYRTIFVHPYSRAFYARNKVLPKLGFDRFVDIEAFADAPRIAGYVSDVALGDYVVDLIAREGPNVFVFVVTMQNHGPWDDKHDPEPPDSLPPIWAAMPDADAIGRWVRHLRATDRMLAPLRALLEAEGRGWLAVFGDHQPALTGPFRGPDGDRRTDYALWSPAASAGAGAGAREDIAAHDIPDRLTGLITRRD